MLRRHAEHYVEGPVLLARSECVLRDRSCVREVVTGFSPGLAFGAHKTAKIAQHKTNCSPDILKILIPS